MSSSSARSAWPPATACPVIADSQDAVGPHAAPPLPVGGRRVAPHRRRRDDVGRAGGVGPGQQAAARVGLGAVAAGDGPVDREPAVQPGVGRVPGHGRVVGVAHADDAVRAADAQHLPQRRDRVGEVLQHLVGVHDVVGGVGLVEGVDVAERELDAGHPRGVRPGVLQWLGHRLDAPDPAGRDPRGDVDGDRPRPAPDVEDGGTGAQVWREVGCRVGDGPDVVGAQHAGRVPVGVGVLDPAHCCSPVRTLLPRTHRRPPRTAR